MKCPKCGSYNKSEYNKCYVCGATLPMESLKKSDEDNTLWTQTAFRSNSEAKANKSKEANSPRDDSRPSVNVNLETGQITADDTAPISPARRKRQNYSIETKRALTRERGVWDGGKTSSSHQVRRGEGNVPIVALDDEADKKAKPARARRGSNRKRKELSDNAKKIQKFKQGTEVAVVVPPETYKEQKKVPYEVQPRTQYKRNVNIKWGRLILVCFLSAAIIFGLIIGITTLVRAISSNFSEIFASRNDLPNNGEPLVERVLIDGQTWHTVTFYGEDGDKILVEDDSHNIKRTLTIHGNQAVLPLDDYSYIPESDEEDYYDEPYTYVDLQAWHFDSDGAETELVVPEYRIAIEQAPLTVISPEEQSYDEYRTQVFVKVKVNPGSRVIIGGKNMTGNVDEDGYTSTYITLDPIGENDININVEADGYRPNKYSLLVNYPEQNVPLELIDAPTEETDDLIIISGKTEIGASLAFSSLTGTYLTNDLVVKANGTFDLRTQFTDFGENEITLTATTPDGRSSTITHVVYRKPYEGSYTRSAWRFDYAALTNSATKLIGQVYVLRGQIIERIDTPKQTLFLFDAGTDGEQQHVIIEYNGLETLKEDIVYDFYADVTGKYDNLPMLEARFVYELQDDTTEDDDSETSGN